MTRASSILSKKAEPLPSVQNVVPTNSILEGIAFMIERQLASGTRTEAIERANDLLKHFLIHEVATYVDQHPKFKSVLHCKLQEFMRSAPTPETAYTIGRVFQRFFA